jgi:predicted ribosomally synthesized peptide with nif11-like leader
MAKGAKDFIEEIGRNAELRLKVFKQSSDVVLGLAKQHGFDFSQRELHDALHDKLGVVPEGRVSDTETSNCVVVIVLATARRR